MHGTRRPPEVNDLWPRLYKDSNLYNCRMHRQDDRTSRDSARGVKRCTDNELTFFCSGKSIVDWGWLSLRGSRGGVRGGVGVGLAHARDAGRGGHAGPSHTPLDARRDTRLRHIVLSQQYVLLLLRRDMPAVAWHHHQKPPEESATDRQYHEPRKQLPFYIPTVFWERRNPIDAHTSWCSVHVFYIKFSVPCSVCPQV